MARSYGTMQGLADPHDPDGSENEYAKVDSDGNQYVKITGLANGDLPIEITLSDVVTSIREGINIPGDLINIPKLIETTIITYTVPTGKKFAVTGATAICTSDASDALYRLKVDDVRQETIHTSWTNRTAYFHGGFIVNVGEVITITLYHYGRANRDFEANLHGILIDV